VWFSAFLVLCKDGKLGFSNSIIALRTNAYVANNRKTRKMVRQKEVRRCLNYAHPKIWIMHKDYFLVFWLIFIMSKDEDGTLNQNRYYFFWFYGYLVYIST